MRYKNIYVVVLVLVCLLLGVFPVPVSATVGTVSGVTHQIGYSFIDIVASSNGTLYAVGLQDTSPYIYLYCYVSYNDGLTWSNFGCVDSYVLGDVAMAIDGDDNLHFVFWDIEPGVGDLGFCYRKYNAVTTSWETKESFNNVASAQMNFADCRGADVFVNSDDNVYIVTSWKNHVSNMGYVAYNWYYSSSETWYGLQTIYGASTSTLSGVAICHLNQQIRIVYGLDSKIKEYVYDEVSEGYSTTNISDVAYSSGRPEWALYDGVIHLVYSGTTVDSNGHGAIIYKKNDGGWGSQTVVCEDTSYCQCSPDISLNSDGTINVVWIGKGYFSSVYSQIKHRVYSNSVWEDWGYITSGSQEKSSCKLIFQDYPISCKLTSGIALVYYNLTANDLLYIDSGSLTWYNGSGGDGGSSYGMGDEYLGVCTGGAITYVHICDMTIEQRYKLPVSYDIKAVDLFVDKRQFTDISSQLETYWCFLNGNNLGSASYFFDCGGDKYCLRWVGTSVTLEDEYPLFEFFVTTGHTWEYVLCNHYGDCKSHSNYDLSQDGIWNGDIIAWSPCMCYYYDDVTFSTNPDYDDLIYVSPAGKTIFYEYESVAIGGTVSSLAVNSYVRLYKDGARKNIQGFSGSGKKVNDYSFTMGFVADSEDYDGSWNVSLWRSDVCINSYNFTVINRSVADYNGLLYVTPGSVAVNEVFTVGWLYNTTYYEGLKARVYYTKNVCVLGDNSILLKGHIITSGTSTYSLNSVGTYYFFLAVVNNGSVEQIFSPQILYVGSSGEDYVSTGVSSLTLNSNGKGVNTIYGKHSQLGNNVQLRVNDRFVYDLTSSSSFEYVYDVIGAGHYEVKVVLYLPDGEVVLSSCSFDALNPSGYTEYSEYGGISMEIWRAVAGTAVIVSFCAFGIWLTKNSNNPMLQTLVVGILCAVGLVFCYLYALFPLALMFMITLLLIVAFIYLIKRL